MKNLFLSIIAVTSISLHAQVGIGTTLPHESAILEINSNQKGFLPPRLNENEKNKIDSPVAGLLLYNTTLKCIEVYTGTFWQNHCCSRQLETPINSQNVSPSIHINFEESTYLFDNNGNPSILNGFVNQIQSNEGNAIVFNEIHTNEGLYNTAGDTIFKLVDGNTLIPNYSAKKFLRRTKTANNTYPSTGTQNYFEYDINDISNTNFEFFVVMRFNEAGSQPNYASVFHTRKFVSSLNSGIDATLQLGTGHSAFGSSGCNNSHYGIRVGHSMMCGDSPEKRVAIDNKFHVFNIRYENATKTITFLIDGEEVENRILNDVNKQVIQALGLFANRIASSASKSEIASLVLYDQLLSTDQREDVNNILVCSYSEL
jgi:hypothetical protein